MNMHSPCKYHITVSTNATSTTINNFKNRGNKSIWLAENFLKNFK